MANIAKNFFMINTPKEFNFTLLYNKKPQQRQFFSITFLINAHENKGVYKKLLE